MRTITLLFAMLFCIHQTYSQTDPARVDALIAGLGNYDVQTTVFGANGKEIRSVSTLRTRKLIIKDSVELVHPNGPNYTIVILCDTIIGARNQRLYSKSNLLISANYSRGYFNLENTRGIAGANGATWTIPADAYGSAAANGANGGGGRDAGCGADPLPWTRSSRPGRSGGSGANGLKGNKGNDGRLGEAGENAGSIAFISKNFDASAEVYLNALGGNGGHGGKGQDGGLGQVGGNGGKGGNGGRAGCSMSASKGGRGGNGGSGGDGGDGGNGGNGGSGGDGGLVKIYSVRNNISPLVFIINNIGGEGGQAGLGGTGAEGGKGGSQGKGGHGGNGDIFNSGSSGGLGGEPGDDGLKGKDGSIGISGTRGARGRILITDINAYLTVPEEGIVTIIRGELQRALVL